MTEKDRLFYDNGELYDLFLHAQQHEDYDFDFTLWASHKYGDPILDLGCGNGRITLHLARHGFQLTGLDLSPSLLVDAQAKAADQQLNITFLEGDMSNFHLPTKFPLIMTTGYAIGHLYTPQQLHSHFMCVKQHLSSTGVYIFATINPGITHLLNEEERFLGEYRDPTSSHLVTIFNKKTYNPLTQIIHNNYIFRSETGEFVKPVDFRMIFPQELDAWLLLCGFDIVEKFGKYDRTPFQEAPFTQIVICRPSQN